MLLYLRIDVLSNSLTQNLLKVHERRSTVIDAADFRISALRIELTRAGVCIVRVESDRVAAPLHSLLLSIAHQQAPDSQSLKIGVDGHVGEIERAADRGKGRRVDGPGPFRRQSQCGDYDRPVAADVNSGMPHAAQDAFHGDRRRPVSDAVPLREMLRDCVSQHSDLGGIVNCSGGEGSVDHGVVGLHGPRRELTGRKEVYIAVPHFCIVGCCQGFLL